MNRILPRIGWALLALVVLALVAVVVARAIFTRYLHSEAFRKTLSEGASHALNASEADFSPLDFEGALVYSQNFHARRNDGGGFSNIDADQVRANFDWHGLLKHTVQIDELTMQRLVVTPPLAGAVPSSVEPATESTPAPLGQQGAGWKVDLRKAVIEQANWQWSAAPAGGVENTALALTPDGQGGWNIAAQGGTVRQKGWPDLHLDSSSLRWQSPTLYINSASLHDGLSTVNLTGSVETRREMNLKASFEGVDVQPFLSPDWRQRVSGRLSGQADIEAPLDESFASGGTVATGEGSAARQVTVSGSLSMQDARLTALPVLDEIGVFTHTQRFRQLDLTRVTAAFKRTPGRVEVTSMIAEAAGLIRVDGHYTIENGMIQGTFQVGVTPETLQWIPGSEEQVFVDTHDGYRWTTMNLSGPVGHPDDDLTPRLTAAAGGTVIKSVEGAAGEVKKAAEGVLDSLLH